MAPELSKGARQTVQSEIWSLGIILYQLVANERPFHGTTPTEVRNKVLEEDISFSILNGWITAKKYQDIIKKMCRRSLGERYQSIQEIMRDLDKDANSKSLVQKMVSVSRRTIATAVTSTLVLTGIVFFSINRVETKSAPVLAGPVLPVELEFPEPAENETLAAPTPQIVEAPAAVAPAPEPLKVPRKLASVLKSKSKLHLHERNKRKSIAR